MTTKSQKSTIRSKRAQLAQENQSNFIIPSETGLGSSYNTLSHPDFTEILIKPLTPAEKKQIDAELLNQVKKAMDSKQYHELLTGTQKAFIVEGAKVRNALIRATIEAAERALFTDVLRKDLKIDTIISGSTGIGKSYNSMRALKRYGLKEGIHYVVIQSNQSMFDFSIMLMIEHARFQEMKKKDPSLKKLIIICDDCDSFFKDNDSINILKGMTGPAGTRKLQYNKSIPTHLLEPSLIELLSNYKFNSGKLGFEVSTEEIVFILTTNFALPTEHYANQFMEKNGPTNRAIRLQHLAAVRRRFSVKDFMLDKATNWGWLAYVTFEDGLLDNILKGKQSVTTYKKFQILDWVLSNWDNLKESNLDAIQDLALKMVEYSDGGYKDLWEADYLNRNFGKMFNFS
jgi:hypothetical protein